MSIEEIVISIPDKYKCQCKGFSSAALIQFYVQMWDMYSVEFLLCPECNCIRPASSRYANGYSEGYLISQNSIDHVVPEKVVDAIDGTEHIIFCDCGNTYGENNYFYGGISSAAKEVRPLVTVCGEIIGLTSNKKPRSVYKECARKSAVLYAKMVR